MASLPNPTQRESRLQFQLAKGTRVRVEVHDISGRLIRVVNNGDREAGTHRVEWDGSDEWGRPVSSGIYFWNVTASGSSVSEKLLLTR